MVGWMDGLTALVTLFVVLAARERDRHKQRESGEGLNGTNRNTTRLILGNDFGCTTLCSGSVLFFVWLLPDAIVYGRVPVFFSRA